MLVQRAWRRQMAADSIELDLLVNELMELREQAVVELQRVWRGQVVRKVNEQEKDSLVLKWASDVPEQDVALIGDFTDPPWEEEISMKHCSYRKTYVCIVGPSRQYKGNVDFQVSGERPVGL